MLAIVLAGFGVALLAARRVLAVAIVAVIFAAFVVLGGLADLNDVMELQDTLFFADISVGPGLPVVIVGGLVALAGSIVALATRRRWPTPTTTSTTDTTTTTPPHPVR